ncbi:MAG: Gfo/Idh/MocA family oxidoreductase [Deltaproteobacteria bacterium]|nr:Gfo/Idh/MocA family oxidoreductase [Deltaproteobacteria bacterium]
MDKGKLRVGVIGVGHLGEYHLQKYKSISKADLIGIVDTNPERLAEIGRRYNVRTFSNHHELLNEVDAVSLAVPTTEHFNVAKEILSRGIHLLVEKPITYKLEPADTLLGLAREKNLILQVGLVERFNPAIVEMKRLISQPVFIESHRLNKFTTRGTDVDVVLDLMIHDLDIILDIAQSEIKEMHSIGMSVVTGKTDIANVRIIFESGLVSNLTVSRVSAKTLRKIRVFQPDIYMDANCLKRELSIIRLDNGISDLEILSRIEPEVEKFPGRDPLADEIASFVTSVTDGSQPVVTGRDGRRALKVTLDIIEQIKKGPNCFKKV